MRKVVGLLAVAVMVGGLSGCATEGGLSNPFSSPEPVTAGSPYFFSEFPDVPIPDEMSENAGETFISIAPNGGKYGVQRFKGRVDMVSLMNTMRRHMHTNGWSLRSLLRSKESVLVFDKADRVCTLVFSDGMIYTDMRIFMSPRLEGDSPSLDISAYSTPGVTGLAQ